MSLNRFRTLPPEVILLVLENLPDPAALLAAILSCHQVYDAVKPHIPSVLKSMPFSRISSLHANLHETSYILCEILRSVHPAPSDFRNLRDQAGFLTQTLVALERVVHHCNGDILALELPFQQCAMQCESIALQIVEKTTQPCDEKIIRGWVNMLSSYNMTFRVVLGKAKLCVSRLSRIATLPNRLFLAKTFPLLATRFNNIKVSLRILYQILRSN